MQHLNINTTLQGGKYQILKVLGQGSFGITADKRVHSYAMKFPR